MKTRKRSMLVIMVMMTMACNLSRVDVDATATQVFADLFSTQTAEAPTITPTFTPIPTETPTQTPTSTETETPTPIFTEAPTLSPTPAPEVLLFDDFSDASEPAWEVQDFADPELESVDVVDGRVLLQSHFNSDDFFGIAQITYHEVLQDFAITVEIEFVPGSSDFGEAGLVIRLTPDFGADYEFTITPDGYFSIFKYTGQFDALIDYTASSAIRIGDGAVNQLTVLADGPSMTFFINGTEVVSIKDDTVHGVWVALVVYNFDEIGTGAYFDNLLITNLPAFYEDPPTVP